MVGNFLPPVQHVWRYRYDDLSYMFHTLRFSSNLNHWTTAIMRCGGAEEFSYYPATLYSTHHHICNNAVDHKWSTMLYHNLSQKTFSWNQLREASTKLSRTSFHCLILNFTFHKFSIEQTCSSGLWATLRLHFLCSLQRPTIIYGC